jgi:WD40 repeat protein
VVQLPAAEPTYWQDVRPILRKYCTVCHNKRQLSEVDVSGGLALDTFDAVVKNKKPLLLPGKSGDSLIIQLVTSTDAAKRMPLGIDPAPPEDITVLRSWIDAGAKEGTRPDDTTTTITTTPPRRRKLDMTLTTTATPPPGMFGPGAPSALKLVLNVGPLSPVPAVAFSPDGKLLAAGSYGRVTVWDLTAAKPAKVLTNVLGAVNDLRFSPDGKLLVVAGGQPSAKGDLRVYQTADWKLSAVLAGHLDVVSGVCFSPDGRLLASASFDKRVRLWDLTTNKPVREFTGHSDFVYAVTFVGPEGEYLASASKDRSVKMVETATGKSKFTFSGADQDVIALAATPDGKSLVSSGLEPGLAWWNATTGEKLRVQSGHGVAVYEVCFNRDGSVLASGGGDATVRIWNGSTGAPVRTITVGSLVYAVALSPDGKLVAAGSFDGLVRLFDVATGRLLVTLLSLPLQGEAADWLALAPEGPASASPGLRATGKWRMGPQDIAGDAVWKALVKPDVVAKAMGAEAVPAPFGK